ncbi:gag-pol polyprotein [Cucumis melo var. makuwa]|uniref:Gag-pol polyprotein n=1 Tax=Cucumis melo var. makuwa TaxID=1194695 RepID=A0A5A7T3I5_CUCMM|nr:gag-pol polyprotein [Cucumis melo var. makuwa]TYK20552.1 gag-pol polyprotein [Cucumis melo var. makuwa]
MASYELSMITVDSVSVSKPEVDWTDAEEQALVRNARALNAIFSGVDLNVFKLINFCSTAKEVRRILEVAYEGTFKVKISRLQLITSKFEALKMSEDESILEKNERVLEIANESLFLGEKIPDSKIVRKVLWSLPRKFHMKVIAIKEAHDITTLKLDELFGSLLTFEMTISDRENKKDDSGMNAYIACIIEIDLGDDSECSDEDGDEDLTFEELKMLKKEDTEARAIQKERVQDLMEENERLMKSIFNFSFLALECFIVKTLQVISHLVLAPTATSLASHMSSNGYDQSGVMRMGIEVIERQRQLAHHINLREVYFQFRIGDLVPKHNSLSNHEVTLLLA